MSNKDWSHQEACVIHAKLENSKLYKVKRLKTERSVAKVKYRCYKYKSV